MLGIRLANGEVVKANESRWLAALVMEIADQADKAMIEKICARVKSLDVTPTLVLPGPQFESERYDNIKVDVQ